MAQRETGEPNYTYFTIDIINIPHLNPDYVHLRDLIEKPRSKIGLADLLAVSNLVLLKPGQLQQNCIFDRSPNQALPPPQTQKRNHITRGDTKSITQPKENYVDDSQQQSPSTKHTMAIHTQTNGVRHYNNGNGGPHVHLMKLFYKAS